MKKNKSFLQLILTLTLVISAMNTVSLKAVEIFRAGQYPQGNFSSADLQRIADNYEPAFLKAPNTIDHAQSGAAYGYVTQLSTNGTSLFADMDVSPELAADIQGKKYLSRSVEIFRDLPQKGMYLKAVSWLGAKTPQVKGLADVDFSQFSDSPSELIEFTVDNSDENSVQFAEMQQKIETLLSQNNELVTKFEQSEAERQAALNQLQNIELNQARLRFESFLNEQIAFGSLPPASKDAALAVLNALSAIPMFEQVENSPITLFEQFISSLPKIEFSAGSAPQNQPPKPKTDYDIVRASHEAAVLTNTLS